MAAIFHMTFSNAFSWMKMLEFRLKFHWSLFLGSNQPYSSIGSDNGLVSGRWQAIVWTNDGYFTNVYVHHLASMCQAFSISIWELFSIVCSNLFVLKQIL